MITSDVDIFLGIDVGNTDHWACTVTNVDTKNWNKPLPNDEAKLTKVYQNLSAKSTLLAVALAQNLGIPVAYLPGLSMRRIAEKSPDTVKTDKERFHYRGCGPHHAEHTAQHPSLGRG